MDPSVERKQPGILLRVLGLPFGLAAIVGGMVGAGILRTPGLVAAQVLDPTWIVSLWIAGAILVSITAMDYVELGSAMPRAGGPYDFVRLAFGPFSGIAVGWGAWLVMVVAQGYLAVVVGEFLQRLGVGAGFSVSALAMAVLTIFWIVNLAGTHVSGASQILFSTAKGLALLGLVIVLLAEPSHGRHAGQPAALIGVASIAIAMKFVLATYSGWQDTVHFCEEFKHPPERTLARTMLFGIAGVTALYLLINTALLHVMPPADMARSNLPAADAAELVFGNSGDFVITTFSVLSVAAITNLVMMKCSRLGFALGRDHILPPQFGWTLRNGTPFVALTANFVIALGFAATGSYEALLATTAGLNFALFILVNAAAIALRRKEPTLRRPFRVPLHPIPEIIAITVNAALLLALIREETFFTLLGFGVLLIISFVYLLAGLTAHSPAPTTLAPHGDLVQ
jgi:APA family basic amino acid/polyamine antiporter